MNHAQNKRRIQKSFIFIVATVALLWAASATSQAQNLYVANLYNTVSEYNATTGATINASIISGTGNPAGLAISGTNLYVVGVNDNTIVGKYNATTGETINTNFITALVSPTCLAISGSSLYVVSYVASGAYKVSEYNATTGETINASLITGLQDPLGLAVSGSDLYVGNYINGTVGEYNAMTGEAINPSFITGLGRTEGLAISGSNLYVTNNGGTVGEYNATTGATINASLIIGVDATSSLVISGSNLYVANFYSDTVGEYNATTGATINALFINNGGNNFPVAIAVSPLPPVISSPLRVTGTADFPFNYQITASNNPTGFVASGLPSGVGYNSSTGLVSGTPTQSGTFAAIISAINTGGTGSATLSLVVVTPPPPVISSTLNTTGTDGVGFNYQITASNNPTSFDATGLPLGTGCNASTGLISGTPIATGTFGATISAINAGGTDSDTLTLFILPPPPIPVITSTLNATGTSAFPFRYQIIASNNPTSFQAIGLPPGVGYYASTGLISGTPIETGTFTGTISAINLGGTGSATLTVTILPPPPVIGGSLTASGTAGLGFSYQIIAGNNPTRFNATGLPAGLSVSASTGLISGTPSMGGTFAATISAINAGGTGSATLALSFTVNLNGVKGSYDGLAAAGGTNAGLFTLSLTNKGGFTGKLTLAGARYPLKGAFTSYGTFSGPVSAGAATLDVALTIDPSLPGVSGTITTGGINSYSVESSLLGKFNASTFPLGLEGKYTAIIPVASGTDPTLPQAPGYGTMSVAATGAVRISGKLGDGTAFSTRGQLHADRKTWTLFKALYAGANPGSIAGMMTFETSANSDCDGPIDWIKPPQASASYYPAGFSISANLLVAKYAPPPLTSSTAAFSLGGGNLPDSAISDNLAISSGSKITVSGTDDGHVTLTLTPNTGAFSGKFRFPGTNLKTSFGGVIFQKPAPAGFGLFLGADQSGSVEIEQ